MIVDSNIHPLGWPAWRIALQVIAAARKKFRVINQ
jgi:hypothetical protein